MGLKNAHIVIFVSRICHFVRGGRGQKTEICILIFEKQGIFLTVFIFTCQKNVFSTLVLKFFEYLHIVVFI